MCTQEKEKYLHPSVETFSLDVSDVLCVSGGFDELNPIEPWDE